jgi:hypothetical protein
VYRGSKAALSLFVPQFGMTQMHEPTPRLTGHGEVGATLAHDELNEFSLRIPYITLGAVNITATSCQPRASVRLFSGFPYQAQTPQFRNLIELNRGLFRTQLNQ